VKAEAGVYREPGDGGISVEPQAPWPSGAIDGSMTLRITQPRKTTTVISGDGQRQHLAENNSTNWARALS
jgi:hypothetical protein